MTAPIVTSGRATTVPPPPPPAIRVEGVHKSFRSRGAGVEVQALRDISFSVAEGSFVTLLGPSGCGKSTMLRLVDGLIAPDSGEVSVFGAPPRPGPDAGFVFQSFRLIPWKTVASNIAFALGDLPLDRAERDARVAESLELVGLGRFAGAYPSELSGGMKQRVALARALAPRPRLLLMDEPFAALDALTRRTCQDELLQLWEDTKFTVLFVTHSIAEAIKIGNRILLLSPHPGRVKAEVNDVDRVSPTDGSAGQLEKHIHELLFAEEGAH
jgi:NitT/TauT family transport system ATP-binding protein